MKTIIATTDYSEAADNAVAYAAALAKYFNSRLILFNTFHLPNPSSRIPFSIPDLEGLKEENMERLQSMAQEIEETFGMKTESVSSASFMMGGLKKLVQDKHADVVVMGMGGSFLTHKLLGNTTTNILRQANFPVLIIPENAVFHEIKNILFACDSRKLILDTNLGLLKKLVYAFNAHLQILQVAKEEAYAVPGRNMPEMVSGIELIFKSVKHSYQHIEHDDIIGGIEKGVHDFQADLLVMSPHKAGFWNTIFKTGNTQEMTLRTKVPLLAIPGAYH